MRRTALLALPVVVLGLGAAALAPTAQGASQPTGSAVSFGVPRIVDPIHVYGEPNLAVNPKTGAVHATGPQGTGTQRSIWNVSVDGGDSYRIVQNLPGNTDKAGLTGILPTKSALGPGGGDTEIKISRDGRSWFNDLGGLATFTSVTTTDDGKTTSVANPLAIGRPVGDRQWMALFDPAPGDRTISPYKGKVPLNYMEYSDQVNGDAIDLSTDGSNYSTVAGEFANDGVHAPNHGVPLVDQHTGKFIGLTSNGSSNSLALAIGTPDAAGLLSFHYNPVADGLIGSPQTLFPVLAQDGSRNLYAVWVENKTYNVYYSWAAPGADDEWKHWSAPRKISQAPANVNVFPWVAADKATGVIDVAWYGTSSTLAQLGSSGPSAKINQTWDLYFSQLTGANTAAPVSRQIVAAPHPMHYNDICLLGTACLTGQGNRNQADFFKMVIDPTSGRARIIYTDSSNRLSQANGTDTAADHQGAALDTVVTQNTGINALTGKPLTAQESTAPVAGTTDPAGDALFPVLGGAKVDGADITSVQIGRSGTDFVATVTTKGALGSAALAAGTPSAQLVVRWQLGDTLYFAAADATAAGNKVSFYGGKVDSSDLCSVSGCKPNYLVYNAAPYPGVVTGTGSAVGGTYQVRIPLSALGNPKDSSRLEEVMAFVAASPGGGVVPQNNGAHFADVAPLQLEGTRTFNSQLGLGNPVAARSAAVALVTTPAFGAALTASGGRLLGTGLGALAPLLGLGLLAGALVLTRRRWLC